MVKCSQTCGAPQAVLLHGKIRSQRILSLRLLYHKSSRCKPTRRYAVFCRRTKDLMVKCSQTCGAPQAVLLHGKIRSQRILSLRLLYHKSSRCKPTRRYAVFCRRTKDLMVKCSQTCGAPQAVLLHGKIRSQRILSLRLLYHKSSRCKPTRRYAVFCRRTKDLMVKCSQTCGAPQAVLLHGKIRSQRILSLRLLYHTSPTPATLSPLFLMNSREFLSHHIYGRI